VGDEVPRPMRLLVATGSRADYGHLKSLLSALARDATFLPALLVTGSHLSSRHGMTIREVEADGYPIAARLEVATDDDRAQGIAASLGSVIAQAGDLLATQRPDAVVVYGDRWEVFGIATAATLSATPIIHIGGGDTTEGAYDEAFRHSITKMAHLHFVTHELAYRKVLQMGESRESVHNVGSLAIDSLRAVSLLKRAEIEQSIGFEFKRKNILFTYHPTTLNADPSTEIQTVLRGLAGLAGDIGILITKGSLDAGSLIINQALDAFAATHPGVVVVESLGLSRYLSVVAQVDAVVGNSSSGIYEVPSFQKPTINIGDRQKGRARASSVSDVPLDSPAITRAITHGIDMQLSGVSNPYGDGSAAPRMLDVLRRHAMTGFELKKSFAMLPEL
jgi:UDP-hydrolysing UDP-N-acetyl-D-glucosamine 2-epimerase